jgi:uncharacterized protein
VLTVRYNTIAEKVNGRKTDPVLAYGVAHATFRFYEELNDFLPAEQRKRDVAYTFHVAPSVKDAIESFGVPHPEVDLIIVDGESVDFSYRLVDGVRVAVYPVFESLDISAATRLRPRPLRRPGFVVDVNLGRLARLLRLFGFDALYRNDYGDSELVQISTREERAILTRDIGVLKRGAVGRGYYVRSQRPMEQLREVIRRFDLADQIEPFGRCTLCNAPLREVSKESVADELPPMTREWVTTAFRCTGCGKLYWRGSHERHVRKMVSRVLDQG